MYFITKNTLKKCVCFLDSLWLWFKKSMVRYG